MLAIDCEIGSMSYNEAKERLPIHDSLLKLKEKFDKNR